MPSRRRKRSKKRMPATLRRMTSIETMTAERTTTLEELARAVDGLVLELGGDAVITGVAYDSRSVQPGDLFFCVPGARVDGHEYAAAASEAGAAALCVERSTGVGLPEIRVADARAAMAIL